MTNRTKLILGAATVVLLLCSWAAGNIYYETLPGLVVKHPVTGVTTLTINGTNGNVNSSGTINGWTVDGSGNPSALGFSGRWLGFPQALNFADQFTGADSTALSAHTPNFGSGTWRVDSGAMTLSGNKATGAGVSTIETLLSDLEVTCDVTTPASSGIAVVFRSVDGTNFLFAWLDTGGTVRLYKQVGGSNIQLTSVTAGITTSTTYEVRILALGAKITIGVNGVDWISFSDATFQTATRIGLRSVVTGGYWDNLCVRAVTTAQTPTFSAISANAASPLTFVTYDGSGQSTHCDVIDTVSGWNGYRYWMAATPYPSSDTTKENPSVWASADGLVWIVPAGVTNPIIAAPGGGKFNSDPDIVLGPDEKLYLFYRETDGATYEKIYVVSSADAITWSAPTLIINSASIAGVLSPSVIYVGGLWVMWYRDNNVGISRRTARNAAGPWSAAVSCQINAVSGQDLFHLNVALRGGIYYGLFVYNNSGASGTGKLLLASSFDGLNWSVQSTPILSAGLNGQWDDVQIYRSALTPTDFGFDLWYCGVHSATYRIGKSSILLLTSKAFSE